MNHSAENQLCGKRSERVWNYDIFIKGNGHAHKREDTIKSQQVEGAKGDEQEKDDYF